MSRKESMRGVTGGTFYAKPLDLVEVPWADDRIAGVETGTTGMFAFAGLAEAVPYEVYQQAGGSPLATDRPHGTFPSAQVDLVDAPNATAVTAIANATEAAMINDGDATALLQAIADKIAGDLTAGDLTALAIVSAIKTDATLAQMISRIDEATSAAKTLTTTERQSIRSEMDSNSTKLAEVSKIPRGVSDIAAGSYDMTITGGQSAEITVSEPA